MSNARAKPIAYLTATFPALSHTFILREIQGIERAGLEVCPVSVRAPAEVDTLGPDEQAMKARTFYLLQTAKNPMKLLTALGWGLTRPRQFTSGLVLALSMRPAGLRALVYQLIYFVEALLLARFVVLENCGHIHNHFANSSCTVGMLAARLAGVPFSFTLHGPSDLFDARHWRLDRKIGEAKFVACISHFARSQGMLHSDRQHWPKLKIVHCGVVPDLYSVSDPTKRAGTRAIFVGRLAAVKGLPLLFDALSAARRIHPEISLTVVGDGPDRDSLKQEAEGISDAIRFTGPLSQAEVAEQLALSDMMILPSFAEGVPVVLMEAMSSGIPVIATRVAGVPELVEDGVNGRVVAPGDVAGLRDAIVMLASDAELRRAMGQAGRAKVAADFDISKESAWLAQIFRGEAADALRPSEASS